MQNYFIHHVEIENFLSFKKARVPLMLNPVIVGRNGFCKSNVIKAFAFGLGLDLNTPLEKLIRFGEKETCVSVVFKNENREVLTITRKYYKTGQDLFFVNDKEVSFEKIRKMFPQKDFCILTSNHSKEEILKKLDGEYEYYLFDNIDANFSKKEIKNILLSKLMEIYGNKEGFLTTNREIVKDCFEIVVYIEHKKDKGSYCSKVAICPHVQDDDSNEEENKEENEEE